MWVLALGEICLPLQTQPRPGLIMCGQWISARRLKRGRTHYLDDCQWSFFFLKAHTTQDSLHLQFFPPINRVSTLDNKLYRNEKSSSISSLPCARSCRRNLPFVRSTKTQPAPASQSAWQSSCVCPFLTCWRWDNVLILAVRYTYLHEAVKRGLNVLFFWRCIRFYLHILLNMGATWDIW